MKRDTMFTTKNILTKLQEGYHDKLKKMKQDTIDMYSQMEGDDTTIGGIEPRVEDNCSVFPPFTAPCTSFDYNSVVSNDIIASIESNEVNFIISCLMRNGRLEKSNAAMALMYKVLMALKTQMMDMDTFVIYNNTKINCNQWSVVILVDTDNVTTFNRTSSNIEFMLSNSGITHPKVIRASEYSPEDYNSPYKFNYNTFTNELSIDVKDYIRESEELTNETNEQIGSYEA